MHLYVLKYATRAVEPLRTFVFTLFIDTYILKIVQFKMPSDHFCTIKK